MKPFNPKFPNIYGKERKGRIKLFTSSITPGITFFDEDVEKEMGHEYRHFDAKRSKLAAAMVNGISQIGFREDDIVLYLGASHGYTPSYVSDIVGKKGFVFAVDFAPRVVRDLVFLSEKRKNIAPILADASKPETYRARVLPADIVYMDVAQRDQAEIFLKNCRLHLKSGGFGLLAVKSRSIDITKKPKQIYSEIRVKLEKEITVVDYIVLDPYEKDHCMFIVKKK
jgi:fibrillarin-like pre-rRNA processing protein